VGFYLLVLLSALPYRNPGEFRHQTSFCATVSLSVVYCGQCADLFCAAHFRGFPLEIRALGWSAAYGAVATFVSELVKLPAVRPIWTDFLENWLPFSVVFFLWCLYFSTKQRPAAWVKSYPNHVRVRGLANSVQLINTHRARRQGDSNLWTPHFGFARAH